MVEDVSSLSSLVPCWPLLQPYYMTKYSGIKWRVKLVNVTLTKLEMGPVEDLLTWHFPEEQQDN